MVSEKQIVNQATLLKMIGAACAAWIIPGGGHFVLGRWKKGLFFLLVLGCTYAAGAWFCGGGQVSWQANPFYHFGEFGSAMTWMCSELILSDRAYPTTMPIQWFDPGMLYMCIAGLLNMLIVLSMFHPELSHWQGRGNPTNTEDDLHPDSSSSSVLNEGSAE